MKKYVLVTLVALSTLGLGSCCRFLDCCFEDPCNPCEMFQGCTDNNNCSLFPKKDCRKVEKSCENSSAPACPVKSACSNNESQSGCSYTPSCKPCPKPCNPCNKSCDPCVSGKKGFSFFRKNKANNSGNSCAAPESNSNSCNSSNSCSSSNSSTSCSTGKCSGGNS